MFQVEACWKENVAILGSFSTLDEAYDECQRFYEKNPCHIMRIYEQSPEKQYKYFFDVVTGNLLQYDNHNRIVKTKHTTLLPLYEKIMEIQDELVVLNEDIQKKLVRICELFDTDAQNTNAPISLSRVMRSWYSFRGAVEYGSHEPTLRASLENLEQKRLEARYLRGQLDEWIHDLAVQIGVEK